MMKNGTGSAAVTRCVWGVMMLLYGTTLHADGSVGVWKTYTSKKEVRDVTLHNGIVWAATSGGMFSIVVADSSIQDFTTSEGLRSNNLSAITTDRNGNVWVGATNGFLHYYVTATSQWRYIADISRENVPQKKINTLAVFGDTLYIGSEIGLSEYLINRDEFRYTARSFGSGSQLSGNVTDVALYRDSIWISTVGGVASAPRLHPNLSAPGSWRVVVSGIPSSIVFSLAVFRDTLYAATARGLARYNGASWTLVPGTSGLNVLRLAAQGNVLSFVTTAQVSALDTSGNISVVATSFSSPLSSLAVEGSQVIVGSQRNGVYVQQGAAWISLSPKGPPSNRIVGIAIDQNGVLWAGTGSSVGQGFMSFDGKDWVSYTAQVYPALSGNDYYKVNLGKDNSKWVSSWGTGVALVDAQGKIKIFNTSNGLPPTTGCTGGCPPTYVVVAGVVPDRDGREWICIRTGKDSITFAVLNQDSSFSYVLGPPAVSPRIFTDVVIDGFGTKWLANSKVSEGNNTGLYFYNERGFPESDTIHWGRITTANGLTGDKIFALAVDQTGEVWVGADTGINIILNPYSLHPQIASYYPLREQHINAIAVDPLNNKWVATNQGVFLLSPDGTSILAQYTVENTDGKLVDNEIQTVTIDSKTGTIYFGSDKGLSTLTTAAIAPLRSFDELTIAPNPFYLPASSLVTIDGLVQNSSLKILSIDGELVKDLKTPGGRIGFWDGTDLRGNFVSSGIYIIVAFSENGNQVAAGKVAVLRR